MKKMWRWFIEHMDMYRLWKQRTSLHEDEAQEDPSVHAGVRTGRDPVATYYSTALYQSFAELIWNNWHEQWATSYHAWLPRDEEDNYYLPPAPDLETFMSHGIRQTRLVRERIEKVRAMLRRRNRPHTDGHVMEEIAKQDRIARSHGRIVPGPSHVNRSQAAPPGAPKIPGI